MLNARLLFLAIVLVPFALIGYQISSNGWSVTLAWASVLLLAVYTGLWFLVRYHSRHTAYQCDLCKRGFAISTAVNISSPHYSGKKRLRCPFCEEVSWCHEMDRSDLPPDQYE